MRKFLIYFRLDGTYAFCAHYGTGIGFDLTYAQASFLVRELARRFDYHPTNTNTTTHSMLCVFA